MGLFDFLKKKPLRDQARTKVKVEMSAYENGKRVELSQEKTSADKADWTRRASIRLTLNSEIRPLEDAMVGFAVALKQKQKIDDEILMLEALIEYYEEIKRKCYTLGPDYIEYFTQSWAEIRAGRDDGPEYVTRYKARLANLKENYNELLEKETLHEKESENLEERVFAALKSAKDILQTDVYKQFHPIVKSDIQSILYFLEKDGRIRREKSGRTYMVHYVK